MRKIVLVAEGFSANLGDGVIFSESEQTRAIKKGNRLRKIRLLKEECRGLKRHLKGK